MDLIYMNGAMEELGVLLDYELDLAFGSDENNFECRVNERSHCCEAGYYLYIEGTEYGGIIDSIEHDTGKGEVVYSGRTWHGILNSRILEPKSGFDYLNADNLFIDNAITRIIKQLKLDFLFAVDEQYMENTGTYQFPRYIGGYDGLVHMLNKYTRKLTVSYRDGRVVLSSAEKHNYSTGEEFDSDLVDFCVKKNVNSVNHLICLGSGELKDRMIVHLYVDPFWGITQTPSDFFSSRDEYAAVYDFPNVESEDELIAAGTDRLRELWNQDELTITLDDEADNYDVGDYVGAYDNVTGTTISAEITKKIVTIKNGAVNISYEVGA